MFSAYSLISRIIFLCSIVSIFFVSNNCHSQSDIFRAINEASADKVKNILDSEKYLVNAHKNGFTPLSVAIKNKNIEISKLLLAYGAEVDSRVGRHSSTPLMIASAAGCKKCVILLLEAGAEINEKDDISMTPLLYSVTNGNLEVVKYLLEKGADIHYKDKYTQENALQKASSHGHYFIVKVLLEKGAKTDFNDLQKLVEVKLKGIPYADESVKKKYRKIVELLKEAKATGVE